MLHIGVITIMPGILEALKYGVIGRAIKQGLVQVDCWDLRQWGLGTREQVDDKPYGGGPGMVMMCEPLHHALEHAKSHMPACKTIYLSPQGKVVGQKDLNPVVQDKQPLLFIAGRYEGIDERIITSHVDEEWSLGDFILSGGELAVMVFMDAIIRLLPESLGNMHSAQEDSFNNNLLESPHYTRPTVFNNLTVPSVLLSGNHQDIARWRRKQSLGRTWLRRPDLLQKTKLSPTDYELLIEFTTEQKVTLKE